MKKGKSKKILTWSIVGVLCSIAGVYVAIVHSMTQSSPTLLIACMDSEARWQAWSCEQVLRHSSFTPEEVQELNFLAGARFLTYMKDRAKAEELLSLFLSRGVDINAREEPVNNWTALHGTVASGEVDNARLLLKYGARTDLIDKNGMTPLDWAYRIQKKSRIIHMPPRWFSCWRLRIRSSCALRYQQSDGKHYLGDVSRTTSVQCTAKVLLKPVNPPHPEFSVPHRTA